MSKPLRLFLFAAALSLLSTGVVLARVMQQGEDCLVPADEVIKGTLFILCQNLTIAGRVEGNVIGIGLRTVISGEVGDNVYLAGLELDLTGKISRDLHFVGLTMSLTSPLAERHRPVLGQVMFASLSAQIGQFVTVPGPITGLGYQILIDGQVNGEVNYWGSAFMLNSIIQGDVYAAVGNPAFEASDLETLLLPLEIELAVVVPGLSVASGARIQGGLEYYGPVEAKIEGSVDGDVTHYSTTPAIIPILPEQDLLHLFFDQFKRELAVLITIGLLSLFLAFQSFHSPLSTLRWRPVHSFVIGMLLFIVSFPIVLILLVVTALVLILLSLLHLDGVLIVVGSLLALVDLVVIGVFYFTAIFVARAVFALGLGRLVLQFAFGKESAARMARIGLITGVVLLALLASLPEIGFLFNAAALFMGLGAIATATAEWLHAFREGQNRSSLPPDPMPNVDPNHPNSSEVDKNSPFVSPTPSQLLPQTSEPVGLDDLPAGFDPDFFFSED